MTVMTYIAKAAGAQTMFWLTNRANQRLTVSEGIALAHQAPAPQAGVRGIIYVCAIPVPAAHIMHE